MNDQPQLITRLLETDSHTEVYLTGLPGSGDAGHAARELFASAAEVLAQKHVQVLQEKIFALRSARPQLLGARAGALAARGLDSGVPLTFLEGTPTTGGAFAGFQLWGVVPRDPGEQVSTLTRNGKPAGRRWAGKGFRLVTLASVDGAGPDGSRSDCAHCQSKQMFENASATLGANDLGFAKVVRTWIYMARILDWYGDFNRVRTAHYAREGLRSGAIFPASTGIQATSDGEECLMDLLAVDAEPSSGVVVRPVAASAKQDRAFSYGSAFSRATMLENRGRKTMYISGTASIDKNGRSLHLEDPEAQVLDTLLCVAALLEAEGAGLENLCHATVYCKTPAAVEAYHSTARRLRLPQLPGVTMIADVCRPELLFELEAVAVI